MTLIPRLAYTVAVFSSLLIADASSQTTGDQNGVFSDARRLELIETARTLTREAFPAVLARAQAGEVEAQIIVSRAYSAGTAVEQDLTAAARWARTAAEKNHPMAQSILGVLYQSGSGIPRDDRQAVEWFRRAAAQGYAQGQSNLGWAYFRGNGIEPDPAEAVRWFRLAAGQGNASGQNGLGVAYVQGLGVNKDEAEARAWYRKAAEQGELPAQRNLAQMLNYGTGGPRDYAQAAVWYRKAADQGDPGAMTDLAIAYVTGEGVRKDKREAEKLLQQASKLGHAIGSYYYAQLQLNERHSLLVLSALDTFALSASQGYPVAAFRLGVLHSSRLVPRPISKDDMQACRWFTIASRLDTGEWEQHQPDAVAEMRKELPDRLAKLRTSLGPTQAAECDRWASEWIMARVKR
ncbi:MAG TPA: tetratricopeptide repeat protein [Vicinamibacterales bacterium]|jgi:TPR repeat protein|nr:tetratricopeptide repeat protein [Vicinamibacterales bacterium]